MHSMSKKLNKCFYNGFKNINKYLRPTPGIEPKTTELAGIAY